MFWNRLAYTPTILILLAPVTMVTAEDFTTTWSPLVRVIDLDLGEQVTVTLCDGSTAQVKLVALDERRDALRDAVRQAVVTVTVNGRRAKLVAATYHLPETVGGVQIDCAITRGYRSNSTKPSVWGLVKDARLRLWPAGSPWIRPGTFRYPAEQRWFATQTQMANVPTYVDGGEKPSNKRIYYHSGLDIGGAEGMVRVSAATDGLVVSARGKVLSGHSADTPVAPRQDVVYLVDHRGWYYRYSHLQKIDDSIELGRVVRIGQAVGILGKEGASGGWSHLHFEIKSRQPSGQWGTQQGYAFLWQAYVRQNRPPIIAVARPHHLILTGTPVELDGGKSWCASGNIASYEWLLGDKTVTAPRVTRVYDRPGTYCESLRVSDEAGNMAYDFAEVQVIDGHHRDQLPPTIHPAYWPTRGIRAGDAITYKVRSFRSGPHPTETWDFGDGSPAVDVHSDGNREPHAENGYAVTTHSYTRPGDYLVSVRVTNELGFTAVGRLHVHVGPRG